MRDVIFPILEYDPNPRAVLEPGHECPSLRLPPNAAFPFAGDAVAEYARERDLPVLGATFGQFLYTADTLANADAYDERDWGEALVQPALELCLRIASEV